MEKWQYTNSRGKQVGWVEDSIYYTTRDYNRNQIFKHPKYESALAVDCEILKDLISKGVNTVRVLVKNFEKSTFWLQIDIKHFLKNSFVVNFKRKDLKDNAKPYGRQRAVAMKYWDRIYISQTMLSMYAHEAKKEGII